MSRSSSLVLWMALASPFLWASSADAYPWMISHNYGTCMACHVDPGGAGQLTQYGRALGESVVRMQVGDAPPDGETPLAGLMWGLIPQPDWLNLSANVRGGAMMVVSDRGTVTTRPATEQPPTLSAFPLLMAADVYATVQLDPMVAHLSLGYGMRQAGKAAVVAADPATGDNALVSREHWLGAKFLDDSIMVRAGRMNLPFGLRNNEHVSFVRTETLSDTNTAQQHGLSLSYGSDVVRAEIMGIAGNFQVRPDAYRERGYAGLVEWFALGRLGLGASSMLTWAARDASEPTSSVLRQAHGVFARFAPLEMLTFLAEANFISKYLPDVTSHQTRIGGVGWLQADWEPVRGLHLMPAIEAVHRGDGAQTLPSLGGWASVAWYPLAHTEVRTDVIWREHFLDAGASGVLTGLFQLHVYL